jgi:hypothetical protein
LPGVKILQSDQSLALDFASYRKSRFRFVLFFVALGVGLWMIEAIHMGSITGFLKYLWAHHPYSYFNPFVLAIVFLLEFQQNMCGGRYSLSRNGTLTGASLPSKHWTSIRYVRVLTWWNGRKGICLGLPENAVSQPWWSRPFVCNRYEVPLPPVQNEDAAVALAKLIGEFLPVEVRL